MMGIIQLSGRLQAVADLVAGCGVTPKAKNGEKVTDSADTAMIDCLADVGTDHGYIPIYMIEQKIVKNAIAMDINKGPLQRAQEHIDEHQLGAYIQTRLSDGLAALKAGEAQVIVIAGMGGATMSHILAEGAAVIGPDTVLVLQPQSELKEFRQYLWEHAYEILAEDMVKEDGKYYFLMKVCPRRGKDRLEAGMSLGNDHLERGICLGTECLETGLCRQLEWRYGPLLLRRRHPVLREYLEWQLMQQQGILERLRRAEEGSRKQSERAEKDPRRPEEDSKHEDNLGQQETTKEDSGELRQEGTTSRRRQREQDVLEEISYIRQALALYEEM